MPNRSCVALVVALAAVTSVTASAQGKPPGQGADACSLVSKAEIEGALGLRLAGGVKYPKMQSSGVLSSCDYATPGGGQVGVLIRRNATKYVAGTEKAEFEKQGMKLRYTTGLGASAFFIDMFGMGTGLGIFRGDYDYVQPTAMGTGGTEASRSDGLTKIAQLVLDRWK